jgi:hypothetical protein
VKTAKINMCTHLSKCGILKNPTLELLCGIGTKKAIVVIINQPVSNVKIIFLFFM